MTQTEKKQLIEAVKSLSTDWDTQYNNGRNDGIKAAVKIIESFPLDGSFCSKIKENKYP